MMVIYHDEEEKNKKKSIFVKLKFFCFKQLI